LIFTKTKRIEILDTPKFLNDALSDLEQVINILGKLINDEVHNAVGPPGTPGNALDIKNVCDKLLAASKELIAWEYRLQEITFPEEFSEMKEVMGGWTKPYFEEIFRFPSELRKSISENEKNDGKVAVEVRLAFGAPANMDRLVQLIHEYVDSNK